MRRVAISTIELPFLLSNYGSFLQHYALRVVLKRMGFEPFRLCHESEVNTLKGFGVQSFRDICRSLIRSVRGGTNVFWKCRGSFRRLGLKSEFIRNYVRLIGPIVECQKFDAQTIGVMGGDQVFWRRDARSWLEGISKGMPRIAFAASTDWRRMSSDESWKTDARRYLQGFTRVGLRELAGCELCRDLVPADIEVCRVADPVLLLDADEWKLVSSEKPVFNNPTLLCYLVNIHSLDDFPLSSYEQLAASLGCGLKIVGIQGAEDYIPSRYYLNLSPQEFLRAFFDARHVITNSFHGSLLAVVLQKSFLSIQQHSRGLAHMNDRQRELMERFGLDARWIAAGSDVKHLRGCLAQPMDLEAVRKLAVRFREESTTWLEESLHG